MKSFVAMGCGTQIEKAFSKSGLPDGVFQTIVGDSSIVDILIDSQDVNAVTLTGSVLESERRAMIILKLLGRRL